MNREEALNVLEQLSNGCSREEARSQALKALNVDPLCMEATVVLSRTEESLRSRERVLEEGVERLEIHLQNHDEQTYVYALKRGLFELATYYESVGKYSMALDMFVKVLALDPDDHYGVAHSVLTLSVMLEKNVDEPYSDEPDLYRDIPLWVLAYKKGCRETEKRYYLKMMSYCPELMGILKGDIHSENPEEYKEVREALRRNSALLNSCPGLLMEVEPA